VPLPPSFLHPSGCRLVCYALSLVVVCSNGIVLRLCSSFVSSRSVFCWCSRHVFFRMYGVSDMFRTMLCLERPPHDMHCCVVASGRPENSFLGAFPCACSTFSRVYVFSHLGFVRFFFWFFFRRVFCFS
jgi:hypothetical protein